MSISLDKFINNLETFSKDPMGVLKDEIVDIVYTILYYMSELTIYDTSQARGIIIKKFGDKYGKDYADLIKDIQFWDNDRSFGKGDSNFSDQWGKKKYTMNITSNDEGLVAQEFANGSVGGYVGTYEGKNYPSVYPELAGKRSNAGFRVRHLTYVADLVNHGNFDSINGLEEKVDYLMKGVESYLFTGRAK